MHYSFSTKSPAKSKATRLKVNQLIYQEKLTLVSVHNANGETDQHAEMTPKFYNSPARKKSYSVFLESTRLVGQHRATQAQ